MLGLNLALGVFITLELLNVIILYWFPDSDKGNGVAAFKAMQKAKDIPEVNRLVHYLVSWVAGTKIIFIALLIVIMIYGDETIKHVATGALVLSIATFYWRLYPMIREMDSLGEINPKGYFKTLALTIGIFIAGLLIAMAFQVLF